MSSLSRCPERRPRPGFTLFETLIASGIGLLVMGAVLQMYISADKVKSRSVAANLMKMSGQAALDDIYQKLHQNAHLFDRETNALPSTSGVSNSWLARVPMPPYYTGVGAVSPGIESSDFTLPKIKEQGEFSETDAAGAANANFDETSAGNALFFASQEAKATIKETGSDNVLGIAFSVTDNTYYIPAYRMHLYYLARRPLGQVRRVRSNSDFTYQIMHWQSRLYLDYHEMVKMMRRIKSPSLTYGNPADPDDFIDGVTSDLQTIANPENRYYGAIDLGNPDGAGAVYSLTPTGTMQDLTATTAKFTTDEVRTVAKYNMQSAFGDMMVAFNTTAGGSNPAVPLKNQAFPVPAYAPANATKPFGFEVMIAGPVDVKQVMVRLVLASRINPPTAIIGGGGSPDMVGAAFQQVIQVYDYFGTASAKPGDAPAPANTTGDWL